MNHNSSRMRTKLLWICGAVTMAVLGCGVLASFLLSRSTGSRANMPVTVIVRSPLGSSLPERHDYSSAKFPHDELSQLVEAFIGNLDRQEGAKLECSFTRALDLGLKPIRTANVELRTRSSAIWPVELTLAPLEDGTIVLRNGSGQVLASDRTADHTIVADATFERLREAWMHCTSTVGK